MTAKQSRPGRQSGAAESSLAATAIVQDAHGVTRCCYCRRPITDAKSVGRGYGPVCWNKSRPERLRGAVVAALNYWAATAACVDAGSLDLMAAAVDEMAQRLDEGAIA